jgi:hypothetical protein
MINIADWWGKVTSPVLYICNICLQSFVLENMGHFLWFFEENRLCRLCGIRGIRRCRSPAGNSRPLQIVSEQLSSL